MKRQDNDWLKNNDIENEVDVYGPPIAKKWRCNHCFHLNAYYLKICENCQSPKGSD